MCVDPKATDSPTSTVPAIVPISTRGDCTHLESDSVNQPAAMSPTVWQLVSWGKRQRRSVAPVSPVVTPVSATTWLAVVCSGFKEMRSQIAF